KETMMPDWKQKLDRLLELATEMQQRRRPEERAEVFKADVLPLINEIRDIAKRDYQNNAYIHEKMRDAEWSFEAIAGLNDGNGHEHHVHHNWIRPAISSAEGTFH